MHIYGVFSSFQTFSFLHAINEKYKDILNYVKGKEIEIINDKIILNTAFHTEIFDSN